MFQKLFLLWTGRELVGVDLSWTYLLISGTEVSLNVNRFDRFLCRREKDQGGMGSRPRWTG